MSRSCAFWDVGYIQNTQERFVFQGFLRDAPPAAGCSPVTSEYKAFYNQLAKPHFATFMGTMASRLIGEMTLKVLGFEKGRAFAEFRHIVMQDGSSFALHDALREVLPGRLSGQACCRGAPYHHGRAVRCPNDGGLDPRHGQ